MYAPIIHDENPQNEHNIFRVRSQEENANFSGVKQVDEPTFH